MHSILCIMHLHSRAKQQPRLTSDRVRLDHHHYRLDHHLSLDLPCSPALGRQGAGTLSLFESHFFIDYNKTNYPALVTVRQSDPKLGQIHWRVACSEMAERSFQKCRVRAHHNSLV